MSWEDFELLPVHPGWKHEFWDGTAHLSPRERSAVARVEARPRPVVSALPIRALTRADETELVSAYLDAFGDTVEYCDWEPNQIDESARKTIREFYAGRRGEAHPASCLSLDPASEAASEAIAGAALLVTKKDGVPMLDVLFVRPPWQRSGLATALVSWALNQLHREAIAVLRSRYHLANEASRAWHRAFGFVEEPDLHLAELYYRSAVHELARLEKKGDLSEADHERLKAEKETWKRRVEKLEAIAREKGREAVCPSEWWD